MNSIDNIPHSEQARHTIRVTAGKDTNTGEYSITDVNVDGKMASRNYVWDTGLMSWVAQNANSSDTPTYDEIDLSYTGANLTLVQYKLSEAVVSTLTLTYDDSNNLIKVVRT